MGEKRTNPASIRFDPEKLELVKRKEKLKSPQKVVDFLIDTYWWQNRLIAAPQLQALGQNIQYVNPQPQKTGYEAYEHDLQLAGSIDELQSVGMRIERDGQLTAKQKETLHHLGKLRVRSLQ